mmetsp:Transcript_6417/g.6632  ORF Transcript_6417/g.6632 Transcript_6417/m.6632 type:complete len:234 (-) Transcript_6417:251-952(-)
MFFLRCCVSTDENQSNKKDPHINENEHELSLFHDQNKSSEKKENRFRKRKDIISLINREKPYSKLARRSLIHQLRPFGLTIRGVIGDGNCFLHSIIVSLMLNNNPIHFTINNCRSLRLAIINYVWNHRYDYAFENMTWEQFTTSSLPKSCGSNRHRNPLLFEQWIQTFQENYVWCDEVMIRATAFLLNRRVVILQPSQPPQVHSPVSPIGEDVIIVNYTGKHFDATQPVTGTH